MLAGKIRFHFELQAYDESFAAAMEIFELSKGFPHAEKYSLTDQIRRSSRSVCANLAEAWRKRRYEAAFQHKLNDAEAEAGETQCWLQFAVQCKYLPREKAARLHKKYNAILGRLVRMINDPSPWLLTKGGKSERR
ncbi:MAG: four helix bundle protein [bacterium]